MRIIFVFLFAISFLFAGRQNLTLNEAISLLKKNSSNIKIAKFNEKVALFKRKIAKSYNYGNLDYMLNAIRSNDAGNVFGFKLQSREATFRDFGFSDFLGGVGQALNMSPNFTTFKGMMTNPAMANQLLDTQPHDLNYPGYRNHFQNKLTYKVPLFTGYKLTQYEVIMKDMQKLSKLDTKKIINEEIYQTKKTFYNISLVENYIKNLKKLKNNIDKLEDIIRAFKKEGYAKDTDIFEVEAKKASVLSYLNQAKLNRDLAYQYLEFLIGVKEIDSISHTNELAPLPEKTIDQMVEECIDLKRAKMGYKITKENIKLKKSAYYPMIGAFGEYSTADDKPFNDFTKHDSVTFGAQLKWNLFDGGKKSAELQEAKIEHMKMAEKLSLAKRGLALKIRQIITEVKSKDFDVKAKQKEFEFTKKVFEQFEGKYKEGLEKISDVLIKHSEEIKALLELLKVKTARNQKVFELESLLEER